MPMTARSPAESHRVATPLELFFDLVFVVAIAQAAAGLHHDLASAHVGHALRGFALTFFAIWWAWMNFTWFASAYDCDDVPYRLATFVQMTGALVFAAGVPELFETLHLNEATVGGYVIMRLALVFQWLRAARSDAGRRVTARRYALGVAALQAVWVALLVVPGISLWIITGVVILELAVPAWAEHAGATPWHPHHITERYGLMTIIVLGESVLAATLAVESAMGAGASLPRLAPVIAGGLLTLFAVWWLYFDWPAHDLLRSQRRAFIWGYGHYFVFASVAAVGAGLAVAVDAALGVAAIGPAGGALAVAVPVVIYLGCLWTLHHRPGQRRMRWLAPVASLIILAAPLTGQGVLVTGVVLVALVAVKVATRR